MEIAGGRQAVLCSYEIFGLETRSEARERALFVVLPSQVEERQCRKVIQVDLWER